MNQLEFERLSAAFADKLELWKGLSTEQMLSLLNTTYDELFSDQPTDFKAFEDGDAGPTAEYGGAELEAGIFNFVMHLVQSRAQTSNPYAARAQVAAWLEEVAAGLKQFTTPEE